MIIYTRRIGPAELRRLHLAHPDFINRGWAVVEINGDDERVIEWFADRFAAEAYAARFNEDDQDG